MLTLDELIKILQKHKRKLGGHTGVICTRYSDYRVMEASDVDIVEALHLRPGDEWLTRAHSTMTDEQKKTVQKFVHFTGN